MSHCFRRVRTGVVVLVAASVTLLSAASVAGAANVPFSRLVAHHASDPVGAGPARPQVVPLRVYNPNRYAAEKAAANAAYARWAVSHPSWSAVGAPQGVSIIALNKPGLHASTSTPPDTTGAAGPTAYLEFVNSQLGVFNRTTLAPIASVAEDTFVHSANTCDGQIKWDQQAKRYLYYSLDCAAAAGSQGFSFGWSKTSSPTPLPTASSAGNWCGYHVGTGSAIEDYGKLGNNNVFMIIGTNEFNPGYVASPIILFPKPPVGSTSCPSESGFISRPSPAGVDFTPEPANVFGSSTPTGYVVAVNETVSTHNALRMYTITGTATAPIVTDKGNVTVPAFAVPASVPQPAPAPASDVIDSSDTRLTQANAVVDPALKTFGIWTQHTIRGPAGAPSEVRWYELEAGKTTPVQTGTIAVSGQFAFNGAISPTIAGNAAAIDYNVGSKTLLVQIRARVHPVGSPAGSMTSETTLATSNAVDEDFSCPSGAGRPCRWGDYAGASFDPNSAKDVWGSSQINGPLVAGHGPQWKTNNFSLIP